MHSKPGKMTFALRNDTIVSISDVESGIKCNCSCPACGATLVAKKGSKVMHHFAHSTDQNCAYGYETSLHLAAKAILSRMNRIVIPPVYIHFPASYKSDILLYNATEIIIDKVELERRFDSIIPDVVVWSGGKCFFVEIYVTHRIDEDKVRKLQTENISTIEIDLSDKGSTITEDDLTQILLNDSPEKSWKYNVKAHQELLRFYSVSDHRKILSRGYAKHIDNCPIKVRIWKGRPYANFLDDCLYCKYCISNDHDGGILCSGGARIASVEDFSIPEETRIRNSDKERNESNWQAIENRICPYCGNNLLLKQSDYGTFWGCSNYPHCRFTINKI